MSTWLIITLISFLPIAECRLGLPLGIKMGLTTTQAWVFSFVGSSLAAPIVILFFMPLLGKMAKTKSLGFIAKYFNETFDSHAKKLDDKNQKNLNVQKRPKKKSTPKRMLAVTIFVALPGPLTGVWGGAAVASLLRLSFTKGVISVVLGNLIASVLVLIFSDFFNAFLDYLIFALLVLAAISIIIIIVKIVKKLFIKKDMPISIAKK